ncbi:MAG: M48 family metalloprotease [Deltaproteobacteria bacterium]|nr:M48 family metalloprotease [Deltaproteobacteria bacterium]
MIYNNLIYFLVVIFLFSANTAPARPGIPPVYGLPLFALVLFLYFLTCVRQYQRLLPGSAARYFAAEKKLSILAVLLFAASLYVFDLKFYLQPLSFGGRLPVLEDIGGIGIFFIFLALMWTRARDAYESVFQRSYGLASFIAAHIKINLPIILPWLVISLAFDLLALLPLPGLQANLNSPWGDLLVFAVFVFFLLLFFPPLVRRLWNCTPMPPGRLRSEIETFCRQQNFSSEILIWPLFEGRVMTAAIMGIVPRLRYLLITPSLLDAMSTDELKAILAHEIGHVKKKHLLLYLALFLGFSVLAGAVSQILPAVIVGSDLFYTLIGHFDVAPETLLTALVATSLLVILLVYFRFIFGYFLRNFERQADLYAFRIQGGSTALKSSFEKIALLSGNIRNQKSWHHFGIGERIDFIEQCERDRGKIRAHDRKLHVGLLVYFLLLALAVGLVRQVKPEKLVAGYEPRYLEAVLDRKVRQEPNNGLWPLLLGDLMQEQKLEGRAMAAYEKALRLEPMNPEINNNLAWLLLTAQNKSLRDPVRALQLARTAASMKKQGYILDTLAVAYWANGRRGEAIAAELEALRLNPENRDFYRRQMEKFRYRDWDQAPP